MSEHARKRARAVLRGRDDGTIILLPDRSFIGWYRHITLVLLVLAYLAALCATACGSPSPPATCEPPPARHPQRSLTIPEVRHLLARLIWPASSSARLVLAWSWWRRSHQRRASYYHTKRRLKAG